MPRGNAPSKCDANQPEIVAALRQCGYCVIDLHALGHGIPDLLVFGKNDTNRAMLLEVKATTGKLTDDEKEFFKSWPGSVCIVRTQEDAIETVQMFDVEVTK